MSAIKRISSPLSAFLFAAGGFGILGTANFAPRAQAVPPRYSDILPLSQVKPGMIGYGLTTFQGTTISRFKVTVIGIVKNANSGHDLILVRMQGGPITQRGANLIHGMSGSPIYLNGKIAGAFSMGENFPKEPIGSVTPIEDMLEAWDPEIPQNPDFFKLPEKLLGVPKKSLGLHSDNLPTTITLPNPIKIGIRTISKLSLNAPPNSKEDSKRGTAVLHRATSFMTVGGVSEKNRSWFQKELDRRGFAITLLSSGTSGAGASSFTAPALRPGSCFGTLLSTGDVLFGGFGTLTYRKGDKFLGFGHPLMGLGPLEGAITSAYVVDVFSGVQTSHLITIPGPVVGTLKQDRNFSVSGDLGKMPKLIPFDVTVRDETTHRSKTFHSRIFQHPELSPALLSLIVKEAVSQVHNVPGDAMAKVTTTVNAEEVGKVTRTNLFFDASDISSGLAQDLGDITNLTSSNPFYPLPIQSASVNVEILPGHNTATIERIFLKQGRYEPGDNIEIGVVLKPFRKELVTKTLTLRIPADTPTGRYQLLVRGGTANVQRFGGFTFGGGTGEVQTAPANIHQMLNKLKEKETNTDLISRLILNSAVPTLEGEKMSSLPPNIVALMRSDRNSGIRMEREEVKSIQPAGYVTSGAQQLLVSIVKKNTQEQNVGGNPNQPPQPGAPGAFPLNAPGGGVPLGNPSGDESASTSGDTETMSDVYSQLHDNPLLSQWMEAIAGAPPKEDKKGKKGKPGGKNEQKTEASPVPASIPPVSDASKPVVPPTPVVPTTPDTANDKPVGRALQTWKQSGRNDFALGKFTGTSLAANGTLRLAPTLQKIATTGETYLWSLVSDEEGNLYAGTGNTGKILKLDKAGNLSVLSTLPAVTVQSLAYSEKDKVLYAGTSLKAGVYKVSLDGNYRLVCKIQEKYVLALNVNPGGDLTIAPGAGGSVYKLDSTILAKIAVEKTNSNEPAIVAPLKPFFKTGADHIMALAEDSERNLFVGTGNEGIIYKVSPDGAGRVLFDAKENAITALTLGANGVLYAATGPRGILYRISPDGSVTPIFERAASFYTGLKTAKDGSIYASTTNAVFHIIPSKTDPNQPTVIPMDNPKEIDFLSLALLPDGGVAAGTGNIGEIYGVGGRWAKNAVEGTGTFESVIHDAKNLSKWGKIRWEGSIPVGSVFKAETRTGDVAEADSSWEDWTTAQANGARAEANIASRPGRFIQYRLTLSTKLEAALSLREIALTYLPRNQAPKVAFQLPAGGEKWAKTQTFRWLSADPDNDALAYELHYSNDAGATWNPLPVAKPVPVAIPGTTVVSGPETGSIKVTVKEGAETPTAVAVPPTIPPTIPSIADPGLNGATLEEFEKQLTARNYPPQIRQALLEGFKLKQNPVARIPTLKEPTKSWDTSLLPDGIYWLRVTASDSFANPLDPQTALAISEPFLICNALPQIRLGAKPIFGLNKTMLMEGTVTQTLVGVTAVQYRIDGGDWIATLPKDGIFDSSRESFSFLTSPLAIGKHILEVEAFNAAGQKSVEKSDILVP